MEKECLKEEYEFYLSNKEKLLQYEGKFVLIKGNEIVDIFSSYEDALKGGLKRFGNSPFPIQQVKKIEDINYYFHGIAL